MIYQLQRRYHRYSLKGDTPMSQYFAQHNLKNNYGNIKRFYYEFTSETDRDAWLNSYSSSDKSGNRFEITQSQAKEALSFGGKIKKINNVE